MDTKDELVSLSNFGFSKYAITTDGRVWSYFRNRFLIPKIHRCRYKFVRLQSDNGIWKNYYIHRLVALMFIPTRSTSLQIDHIDGNKFNNDVSNLRWVSNRENAHAAMRQGLMPHAVFKNDEIVEQICAKLQAGESVAKISRETNFPYSAISAIRMHRNWTHISSKYTFPPLRDRSVMPDIVVHEICKLIVAGKSNSEIAKITSEKVTLINRIRNGQNFKYISKKYFVS